MFPPTCPSKLRWTARGRIWKGGHSHELQVGVTDQLPGKPEERLLKVVVGLGRDVVVLCSVINFLVSDQTQKYRSDLTYHPVLTCVSSAAE